MSFKKKGSPVEVEKISFEDDKSAEVTCHKCQAVIGRKSCGLFQAVGSQRTHPLTSRIEVKCPECDGDTYAL